MGTIALRIESDLANAYLVGICVKRLAERTGFDARAAGEIELAVVEAVTNSIRHGYRMRSGRWVDVELLEDRGGLEVRVSDSGEPPPPDLYDSRGIGLPDGLVEGGRGRFLISNLMDEVELILEGERNTLRLVKRLD